MKYSLMTHMIDTHIKLSKPTFIHLLIMKAMGYTGPEPTLAEAFAFLREHGMPVENGTMTFRDCVRFAKESGFDGIDVMAHHFNEPVADMKAALEDFGIVLSAININEPFSESVDEADFSSHWEKVKDVIDRGTAVGCKTFLVIPTAYTPAPGRTLEETYRWIVRGLDICVDYGRKLGVTIATETLESSAVPLCSIGNMERLFAAVPELQYSHDTCNALVALEDPLSVYEALKERVALVHFKDLAYTEKKTDCYDLLQRHMDKVAYGEGRGDFVAHLQALKRDSYRGYITLEGWRPAENQLEGAVAALQYFRALEQTL